MAGRRRITSRVNQMASLLPLPPAAGPVRAEGALRQRPSACATRSTASSSRANDAWYAAAPRATRITCALPNPRLFVSRQPCLVCGRAPTDPHHVRFAEPIALGRKVSDEFTVPVCRMHHREIHRHGDEAAWWKKAGIEPLSVALTLWRQTHPLGATVDRKIGEDAIGASPRPGEVERREIDKTNPFAEAGQQ